MENARTKNYCQALAVQNKVIKRSFDIRIGLNILVLPSDTIFGYLTFCNLIVATSTQKAHVITAMLCSIVELGDDVFILVDRKSAKNTTEL